MYRYMITATMTQISRRRLNPSIEKRIYAIFVHVITTAQQESDVKALLEDFFTPTERVMLPKRLCIAYLLLKAYPHRVIASYLNVSFTTINRVSLILKTNGRGYTILLTKLQKIEQYHCVLESIETGIVDTLAAIGGPTRVWKNIQHMQRKHKQTTQTPF